MLVRLLKASMASSALTAAAAAAAGQGDESRSIAHVSLQQPHFSAQDTDADYQ